MDKIVFINNYLKSFLFFLFAVSIILIPNFIYIQAQGCCTCTDVSNYCFYKNNYPSCDALAASITGTQNRAPAVCRPVECNDQLFCPSPVQPSVATYQAAQASAGVAGSPNPLKLKLNVAIPGLEEFSQGQGVTVDNSMLGKYIGGLYRFFIGIAGIIAVLMIVYGGIIWLFSGGNAEKVTSAKETIFGAVIGLGLALGSYLILYNINPALVGLNPLPVGEVPLKQYVQETGNNCSSDQQVIKIPSINHVVVQASDARLTSATVAKLQTASSQVQGTLVINSAYRSYETQARLYNCYQTKINSNVSANQCPTGCSSCNQAAKPSCSAPHQTGQAIDVCLRNGPHGSNTCNYVRSACNNGNCLTGNDASNLAQDQAYLQQLMANAGFTHFCGEWWHFESVPMSLACSPGQYNPGAMGGD